MVGVAGFLSSMAQFAGGFAVYKMLKGEIYDQPLAWIIVLALCAWYLLVCIGLLIGALTGYYRHLDDKDPVTRTFFYSSPDGSLASDLKSSMFMIEIFIFAILITPGEGKRAKRGFR